MAESKGKRGAQKQPVVDAVDENLSSIAAEMIAPTEVPIREVMARVEEAFKSLGTEALPGTIIPVGKSNNAKEAAEFALADALAKLATSRLKEATEAAEKAGVFGDKNDWVIGSTTMVFNDPNFSINVKMGKPSQMVKRELVEAAADKFLGKRASEFLEECKGTRAATKTIIVAMK
jgi:hypothetical protein